MLIGKTIEYTYTNSDTYQVKFSAEGGQPYAHWRCLTGEHAGEHRKEKADIEQIVDNIYFVSWLEPTLEVVSFVLNLDNNSTVCSYYYDGERLLLKGKAKLVVTK